MFLLVGLFKTYNVYLKQFSMRWFFRQ